MINSLDHCWFSDDNGKGKPGLQHGTDQLHPNDHAGASRTQLDVTWQSPHKLINVSEIYVQILVC